MNFSFYIYGTPNGYNQYPSDRNSIEFQKFAENNSAESQLTVCRRGQLVYYAYMRKLQEKTNDFIGFCLIFNGVYCNNPQRFFSLFDRAYNDMLKKGELLKFEKGKCLYAISKFAEKQDEIDRIKLFFKSSIESDFNHDFTALSFSFKVSNSTKTISIKENNNDILSAIAEFDCVHIFNDKKYRTLIDEIIGNKTIIIYKLPKWLWWVLATAVVIICSLVLYLTLRPEKIVEIERKTYTLSQTNRQFTYQGEFKNDTIPHGKGVATFEDYIYEGDFFDGKIEGMGKITYIQGDGKGDVMEGKFIDNNLDSGVFISPVNKCRKEGFFREREIFDGIFVDSIMKKISIYKNGEIIDVKSF